MPPHKMTKKELKHDGFVERTEKALEFGQRHATVLGIAVLVVVVLIFGVSYLRNSREAARVQAGVLFHRGETLLVEGQPELAEIPLREAVEQYSGTEFGRYARVSLARALLGMGEHEVALADIDRWLGEIPEPHPVRRGLQMARATALDNLERFVEAAGEYAAMAATAANDQERYDLNLRRAACLRRAGQPRDALTVLEELEKEIQSGDLDVRRSDLSNQIEFLRALAL